MKKTIALCLGGVLLTGCGPVELPMPQEYALVLPIQPAQQAPKTDKAIVVATSMAEPGYRSAAMIYTQQPYELQRYVRSRWVAPPSNMLGGMVINALQQAHYFKAVTTPSVSSRPDYQLNVHLDSLQQSFLQPTSCVHLAVTVTLIDVTTLKVLATHAYVRDVDAPGNNAYAGVIAANQAAQWVAKQVAEFVRQSIDTIG